MKVAHLDQTYQSFKNFLTPAEDAPWSLEGIWKVNLTALNSSGVSGSVILALSEEEDGTPILNVSISASGLTPNQTHVQHIHGLLDADGNPVDSNAPTLADDADRDGLVEVLEGVGSYGDVILSLLNARGNMPNADGNGQVSYINNFDISDMTNLVSPVTGTQYTIDDLLPLMLREVVLHGVQVPDGIGDGTSGEVNGQGGYVPILPAAAGDIEITSVEDALDILEDQAEAANGDLVATADNPNIFAGEGDDTVSGSDDDNQLFGGNGDDVVFGAGGDDTIGGGSGDDELGGGAGDDTIFAALGDDTVYGGAGSDRIGAGSGDDRVFGGGGDDTVFGGDGDDTISAAGGNDRIFGGLGRDVLDGGSGDDNVRAGPDGNAVNAADGGASGALTLDDYDNGYAGGAGNDTIRGRDGDDIITGDDDSRVSSEIGGPFDAGADGSDLIFGGAGNDEIHSGSWADSDDGLENSQTGTANDTVFAGDGDDIVRGAGGDDFLGGGTGDDNMGGGGGADTLRGGSGDDTIFDNSGSSIIDGDTGNDTIDASSADDDDANAADEGASGALALADYDQGIAGGAGDDIISGGDGADIITGDDDSRVSTAANGLFDEGADGSDVILGGGGNDEIHSGTWADSDDGFMNSHLGLANDTVFGGEGDDIIRGAGGDDLLSGDEGDDNMGGGGGADTFLHSGSADQGTDTIIDFSDDGGDVLSVLDAAAEEDDFTFNFEDRNDDAVDDLVVSYNDNEIFVLNGFEDGGQLTIETPDESFTFTPMDDPMAVV